MHTVYNIYYEYIEINKCKCILRLYLGCKYVLCGLYCPLEPGGPNTHALKMLCVIDNK